jgi:hypothetical protein
LSVRQILIKKVKEMLVKELISNYNTQKEEYYSKRKAIDEKIQILRKKIERVDYKNWVDMMIKPICEELAKRNDLLLDEEETYNVFGMRAECPVFFETQNGKTVGLCFTIKSGKIFYDTGNNVREFEKGTIGDLNGFGNEIAEVKSIEQLSKILINQMK